MRLLHLLLPAALQLAAAPPTIFYTDLDSGPNEGGEGGRGVFVTVYGANFGPAPSPNRRVLAGGAPVAAHAQWTSGKIVVQLGQSAKSGPIVVETEEGRSNGAPFTVRPGRIFFVAPDGSDSAAGTVDSPWASIRKCKAMLLPGDTCYLRDGLQQTNIEDYGAAVAVQSSGEPGRPKALVAYPGAVVSIGRSGLGFGLRTPSIRSGPFSYWTVAGLRFQGIAAMELTAGAAGWRIVANQLRCPEGNGAAACFTTSKASDVAFLGNEVFDAGCSERTVPCGTNTGPGTVSYPAGGVSITGRGSQFIRFASPGMWIQLGTHWRVIASVESDTALTVSEPLPEGGASIPWKATNGPGFARTEGNALILPSVAAPASGKGLVSVAAGSNVIEGQDTSFTRNLAGMPGFGQFLGTYVRVGSEERLVTRVTGDSRALVSTPFGVSAQGVPFTYRQAVGSVVAGDKIGFPGETEREAVFINTQTSTVLVDKPFDQDHKEPAPFYFRHVVANKLYHSVYFSTDTNGVDAGWNYVHDNSSCRGIQFHSSPLTSIARPTAPAVSAVRGGRIPARKYQIAVSFTQRCYGTSGCANGTREGALGLVSNLDLDASESAKVTAPPDPCRGAEPCRLNTFYNVYAGEPGRDLLRQNDNPLALGQDWIEPPDGLRGGPRPPAGVTLLADGYSMHHLSVHDNVIRGQVCDGINLATVDPASGPVRVFNNVVIDVGRGPDPPPDPAAYFGIYIPGTANNGAEPSGVIDVFNNTFLDVGNRRRNYPLLPAYSSAGVIGRTTAAPALRVNFVNNIIAQPFGSSLVAAFGGERFIDGGHNLLFLPAGPESNLRTRSDVVGDPLFADLDKGNLEIRPGSPAIDGGQPAPGVTYDIAGVKRPQGSAFDIGAHEYASEPTRAARRTAAQPRRTRGPGNLVAPDGFAESALPGGAVVLAWKRPAAEVVGYVVERCTAGPSKCAVYSVAPRDAVRLVAAASPRDARFRIRAVYRDGLSGYAEARPGNRMQAGR